MQLWNTINDVNSTLSGSAKFDNGRLTVTNEDGLRQAIETVVKNAVFNADEGVRNTARSIVWEASKQLGCPSASIHDYYMARARDAFKGSTVPAINIRGMTFDTAKTVFKTLRKLNAKACLFEIARSEMSYTKQRPAEYSACILAAAIATGHKGPVFIQGDHFQANSKKWKEDPKKEIDTLKNLIKEAIAAGFYNIDIDTSTLVDLGQPTVSEQQRNNYTVSAELIECVRENEPKGITISIGGEIGEVGKKNSTAEELIAYYEGVQKSLGGKFEGPSKISIQTGTSHGGVPLPDGTVAEVKLDFKTLEELGKIAREKFHIGGVVQHGASTLPEEAFDHFPKTETVEVHLATGFQNTVFDSKNLPKAFREEIYNWLSINCADEKKPDQTEEQFFYKSRKKGFGPFKEKWWTLPAKDAIMSELAAQFEMMFKKLGIQDKANLIDKYIKI